MSKIKYYNNNTKKWEYAETGGVPQRGIDYWTDQDVKPLYDFVDQGVLDLTGQCRLCITIQSNQTNKSAIEGLEMEVALPNGYVAVKRSGETIMFPPGDVRVVFPEIRGYSKPEDQIIKHMPGSVNRKFTYAGEVVTVNPVTDGVQGGYSYTVDAENMIPLTEGALAGAIVSGVTQWLVPCGTTLTVTPEQVDGYRSSVVRYVPSNPEGTVTMEWFYQPNGPFIMDTDGKLWYPENWDWSATPDCVVIVTDEHKFGIALTENSSTLQVGYNSYEESMTEISSTDEAKLDFNGHDHSAILRNLSSSTSLAAGWCYNFQFPSRDRGYLGSAGEWWMVINNKEAINNALATVGGEALFENSSYWTSSYYKKSTDSSGSVSYLFWNAYSSQYSNGLQVVNVTYQYSVRAFKRITVI